MTDGTPRGLRIAADEPERFGTARHGLAALPAGVLLIAAAHGDSRSCATGTAMYVSFVPPLVAVALYPGAQTTALAEASGRFTLSLMGADQAGLAHAAGKGGGASQDKFADLGITAVAGPGGAPAVAEARARFWCRVVDVHDAGDHRLFIGEVEAYDRDGLDADPDAGALVRFIRRYAALGPWLSEESAGGYPT